MNGAEVKLLGCFLLASAAAHGSHLHLNGAFAALQSAAGGSETLPTAEALRILSIGYTQLTADYYWLRSISHFGDKKMHRLLYPKLYPLLERVVALDPYFASAYIFAGSALTLNGMDVRLSNELLQQGMRYRPDQWKIPFYLGFNLYYFLGDFAGAARVLNIAASLPEAPPMIGPLASRLAAEGGEPAVGLQLVDHMLASTQDPQLRSMYEHRRRQLLMEAQLMDLQKALETYEQIQGHRAHSLEDLVNTGTVSDLPADPFGGEFSLDPNGRVTGAHMQERLRLAPRATGHPLLPAHPTERP